MKSYSWCAIGLFAALVSCRKMPVQERHTEEGPPPHISTTSERQAASREETPERPSGPVRRPYVAGFFYPGEPAELRAKVAGYIASARKIELPGRLIALIAPHAGYDFSGPTAGWAFKQLEGLEFETIFLIGGHASELPFAAVFASGAFETPLGNVKVDAEAAKELVDSTDAARADVRPHISEDHALEVMVPFIQVASPKAAIVPIYYNRPDPVLAARVGAALGACVSRRKALILCSTDLSHYPDASTAERSDRAILDAICTLDPARILAEDRRLRTEYNAAGLSCSACGLGAVLATVEAAKAAGATGAVVLRYENSGSRPRGDKGRVVGYGAVAIYGGKSMSKELQSAGQSGAPEGRLLSDEERSELLALARASVKAAFRNEPIPTPKKLTPGLQMKTGAFVTLHKRGQLRGCIGTFERSEPLWRVVAEYARHSAFDDTRFPPLEESELPEVEFEISVLSPMRKLENPLDLRLGIDGIWIVGSRGERGTFLPQVATETGWTKEEFLSNCCLHKAGLPPDAWRDPKRATVYAYTAEVFSESKK